MFRSIWRNANNDAGVCCTRGETQSGVVSWKKRFVCVVPITNAARMNIRLHTNSLATLLCILGICTCTVLWRISLTAGDTFVVQAPLLYAERAQIVKQVKSLEIIPKLALYLQANINSCIIAFTREKCPENWNMTWVKSSAHERTNQSPNATPQTLLNFREGDVVEGSEDDIQATYYMLAFQREFLEKDAELRWKVVDMMVIGGQFSGRVVFLVGGS